MAKAKQLRPAGLQLWTFASNVRAQRFYERHGFVVVERTDGSGNEEKAPGLRYRWMQHKDHRDRVEGSLGIKKLG